MNTTIRTEEREHCGLCGSHGSIVHSGLTDHLFGAPGIWGLRKCSKVNCGILWPNPMPLAKDIGKAYLNYYTHSSRTVDQPTGTLRKLYRFVKRGYIAGKYGYPSYASMAGRLWGRILYCFPVRRADVDDEVRQLMAVPNGRVLDVGCGAGEWLEEMRRLGWEAEGVDFDANAVNIARGNGLRVQVGTVAEQKYPDNHFDAVTLNHVIEHVPDPLIELRECLRILKPGGKLALATPNCESWGYSLFKESWRGLEPPRHLQIMTVAAMRESLISAGFRSALVTTRNSYYVWVQSCWLSLERSKPTSAFSRSLRLKLAPLALTWLAQIVIFFRPRKGECISALATK